jgi:hypothetical protein
MTRHLPSVCIALRDLFDTTRPSGHELNVKSKSARTINACLFIECDAAGDAFGLAI